MCSLTDLLSTKKCLSIVLEYISYRCSINLLLHQCITVLINVKKEIVEHVQLKFNLCQKKDQVYPTDTIHLLRLLKVRWYISLLFKCSMLQLPSNSILYFSFWKKKGGAINTLTCQKTRKKALVTISSPQLSSQIPSFLHLKFKIFCTCNVIKHKNFCKRLTNKIYTAPI